MFGLLVMVGALLVPFLSYKLLPANYQPTLRIDYYWPNTPQNSVEREVTTVLEGVVNSLDEVVKTYSITYDNQGEIFVDLKKDTDLDWARFAVANLLRQAYPSLPEGVQYPRVQLKSTDDQETTLLQYAIASPQNSTELQQFFNSEIHPELAAIDGVEEVQLGGLPRKYLDIIFDYNQLQKLGISKEELATALRINLENRGLGVIRETGAAATYRYSLQQDVKQTTTALSQIPLALPSGENLQLGDLAELRITTENGRNFFRVNGERTVNFSVTAHKSANHIRIADVVKEIITKIDAATPVVAITETYDATAYLKRELSQIIQRSLLSLGVLLLITVLMYRRWRPILQLFLSLLTSLSLAVIAYKLLHIDIHLYSLLGLTVSLGFVMDNAIIAIDHYRRSRSRKIVLPLLAATLTTICPLLLIFSLEEEIRQNLSEFALVIAINLVASLLVSLFLLPAIIRVETKKVEATQLSRLQAALTQGYAWLIVRLNRYKIALAVLVLIALGSPHTFFPVSLGSEIIGATYYNDCYNSSTYQEKVKPVLDQYFGGVLALFANSTEDQTFLNPPQRTKVMVNIQTPAGATFEYIDRVCYEVEDQIGALEAVDIFETTIFDRNNAQLKIYFKPAYENTSAPLRVKGFLEEIAANTTGADFFVMGVGKPYSNSITNAADGILVAKGYDLEMLQGYVQQIKTALENQAKISQVQITSEPSWQIIKNATLNADYLPTLRDRSAVLNTLVGHYSQQELGTFLVDGDERMLRLQPRDFGQKGIYDLQHQYFAVSDSTAFKTAYNFALSSGLAIDKIIKDNQQYQLVLQVGVNGTNKLKDVIFADLLSEWKERLPLGFDLYEEKPSFEKKADWRLAASLLVALLLVFAVCAILFESLRDAWVVIWNIPVTFIPVLYVLAVCKIGFDQGVFAGLILLIGLLINSVLFIIYEFRQQLAKSGVSELEAYLAAFRCKIMPVLITAISTMASLFPYVLQTENSFWHTFSITVLLGLLFSTLAMVIVLPVFLLKVKQ